jgi:type I restriction enzyme, S subunit
MTISKVHNQSTRTSPGWFPADWDVAAFGKVFDFISTFQFTREELTEEKTRDGIQYIHYGDIHAKFRSELLDLDSETLPYVLNDHISIQELESEEFPYLKDGDLIIADVSEDYEGVGKCVELTHVNGRKIVGGLHTFVARDKAQKTTPGIRTYLLKHLQVSKELKRIATGTSVYGISKSNLAKVDLAIPPLPEQRKIASILSTWERALEKTEALIEEKKKLKHGLIQQLFPLKGKIQPSLRFPEFQGSGKWEESQLGDVCHMQAGKFVSASDILDQNAEGLYPCYGGNGLRGYTSTFTHTGKYPLIGRQGALCGNVKLGLGNFHATEHAVVVTPVNKLSTDWLFYLLDFLNLNRFASGQAQPGLSVDVLEKVLISFPIQKAEQQLIADCLGTLDREISLLESKEAKFREQKNGLMQNLLTGLVRVKV